VKKDLGRALEYLNKAADKGSADALNGLGFLYFNGEEVTKDAAKALEYFQVHPHPDRPSWRCAILRFIPLVSRIGSNAAVKRIISLKCASFRS